MFYINIEKQSFTLPGTEISLKVHGDRNSPNLIPTLTSVQVMKGILKCVETELFLPRNREKFESSLDRKTILLPSLTTPFPKIGKYLKVHTTEIQSSSHPLTIPPPIPKIGKCLKVHWDREANFTSQRHFWCVWYKIVNLFS